ncbi:MAG: hypothetical protein PHY93_16305, partial [Bacteriovorax sp.]|nr:hypothetical protein [Bacteriovorax sp.]
CYMRAFFFPGWMMHAESGPSSSQWSLPMNHRLAREISSADLKREDQEQRELIGYQEMKNTTK